MVVNRGTLKAAWSISSKPITDTSLGTFRPASRNARIAPMAEPSLKATSAVKSREAFNSSLAAWYPKSAIVVLLHSGYLPRLRVNLGAIGILRSAAAFCTLSQRSSVSPLPSGPRKNAIVRCPNERRCFRARRAARALSMTILLTSGASVMSETATTGTGSRRPSGVLIKIMPSTPRSNSVSGDFSISSGAPRWLTTK